jgi:anti-anti-sigma factor
MSSKGFDVSKTQDVTVVTFASAAVLDISTSQSMAKDLLRLADGPPPPRIIVDFSAVRFLASRMLGVLVELSKRAEAGQGRVVVCGLRGDLSRLFRVTQLDRLLTLADDRDRAMQLLGEVGEA